MQDNAVFLFFLISSNQVHKTVQKADGHGHGMQGRESTTTDIAWGNNQPIIIKENITVVASQSHTKSVLLVLLHRDLSLANFRLVISFYHLQENDKKGQYSPSRSSAGNKKTTPSSGKKHSVSLNKIHFFLLPSKLYYRLSQFCSMSFLD